jgi:hypothetical protein
LDNPHSNRGERNITFLILARLARELRLDIASLTKICHPGRSGRNDEYRVVN